MNNLEYLNQISQETRPTSTKKSNPLSLVIKIAVGGIVAFLFVMCVGIVLNAGKSSPTDLAKQLYVRTANLNTTLTTYNKSLKSSQLRAIGTSLNGVLTGASASLSNYLLPEGGEKGDLNPPEKLLAIETATDEELNTSLNNAKLNGILDRVYANQIQLQVSLLIAFISQLEPRTKDEALLDIITQYQSNLYVIEQSLENYSSPSD